MNTLSDKVHKYITSEGLSDLYPILIYQIKLCEARNRVIKDGIEKFNHYLKDTSADSTIRLHITQLDIVSKLFMFIEDYLSFSYYLRISKKELPKKIHSQNGKVWEEIKYLDNLKVKQIQRYLLLENVNKLSITNVDKEFVNSILNVIFTDMHRRINRVMTFYKEYHRVYNKYKHVLTSIIGTYSFESNVKKPRIYIRDKYKNTRKNNIKDATYVLPTDAETILYYEKVNLVTGIPPLNLRIDVKQSESSKMLRALSNKYIFVSDKDIIKNPENTLRIDDTLSRVIKKLM